MAGEQFHHGIETIEVDSGGRTINTIRSSVIGVVGTAPDADEAAFPLNQPTLIANSQLEAAKLGSKSTLPAAMDGIFDQGGAVIVAIRVEEGATSKETISNIVGGVAAGNIPGTQKESDEQETAYHYSGVHALKAAVSATGVTPKILIAPGFTQFEQVTTQMVSIADRLKAIIIADGPNATNNAAVAYAKKFGSSRVYVVDPWVQVWDTTENTTIIQPPSSRVAGLIAASDQNRGFWYSPSNMTINGINGLSRPIDFALDDPNCAATLLNENKVATIIQEDGYRLWGNRSCSMDSKWAFLSVRRTADMIAQSVLQSHFWAVDRPINRALTEEIVESVNAYLRTLKTRGAILGGQCWLDKELNTAAEISQGRLWVDFKFTPCYPAEHINFKVAVTNDYIEEAL